jgi:hypothetical protein
MARLFSETITVGDPGRLQTVRRMDLPYGSLEAKAKVDLLTGQAVHFSQAASLNRNARSGYKADVLMAAWFPMKVIRRWGRQAGGDMIRDYTPAFTGMQRVSWSEPPWGRMSA